MPYTGERASKTGHLPVTGDQGVRDDLAGLDLLDPVDATEPPPGLFDAKRLKGFYDPARRVIAVDGSNTGPIRVDDRPAAEVAYWQVGAVSLDLDSADRAARGPLIDPQHLAEYREIADRSVGVVGLRGVRRHGTTTMRDSWRQWIHHQLNRQTVADRTLVTILGDLHDGDIRLRVCPANPAGTRPGDLGWCDAGNPSGAGFPVPVTGGGVCPGCDAEVYPTDVLDVHSEVDEIGRNFSALGRLRDLTERISLYGYFTAVTDPDTAFVLDGPLAVFGAGAPLKRVMLRCYQQETLRRSRPPLLFGAEKTGMFVEHGRLLIGEPSDNRSPLAVHAGMLAANGVLPPGHGFAPDENYIRTRIKTAKPSTKFPFGYNEYIGRVVIYRTLRGRCYVITVPPPEAEPYPRTVDGTAAPFPDGYPQLGRVLATVERCQSDRYHGALSPLVEAHRACAIPTSAHDVFRALARDGAGLPYQLRKPARLT